MAAASITPWRTWRAEPRRVPFHALLRSHGTTARNGEGSERPIFRTVLSRNGAQHGSKIDAVPCRLVENGPFFCRFDFPAVRHGVELSTERSARKGAQHGLMFPPKFLTPPPLRKANQRVCNVCAVDRKRLCHNAALGPTTCLYTRDIGCLRSERIHV